MKIKAYNHFIGLDDSSFKDKIPKNIKMYLIWHLYKCKKEKKKWASSLSSISTTDPTEFISFGEEGLRFLNYLSKKHRIKVLNFYHKENDITDLLYVSNNFKNNIHGLSYEHCKNYKLKSIDGFDIDFVYVDVSTISFWVYFKYYVWPLYYNKVLEWSKKHSDIFKCIEIFGKFFIFLVSILIYLGILKWIFNIQ